MNVILKSAAAAALVGALALASATPGEARSGRYWGAAGAGFAAGALVGAAAANSNAYGSGYYAPGYAYAPAYSSPAYGAYAYEGTAYPAQRYYRGGVDMSGCASEGNYGQIDRSACNR
jgi:hypothetical protein